MGKLTLLRIDAFPTLRCRSNTVGQIAVGGNIKFANAPNVHSAFTVDAHRLCSWRRYDKMCLYQFFVLCFVKGE